jgi:hypothetical protein
MVFTTVPVSTEGVVQVSMIVPVSVVAVPPLPVRYITEVSPVISKKTARIIIINALRSLVPVMSKIIRKNK